MSIALLAIPTGIAVPYLRSAFTLISMLFIAARPILGLGFLAAFAWLFKPLLRGLARACLMSLKPRRMMKEREQRAAMQNALTLNHMARELDTVQPNLAAELRLLAARG
ncbi:MAG: hypothetical protein NVSMB6_08160 [Burkholderiaceae bacterium]